ncbi:MAG: hypothetical protein IIZ93_03465, partial [Acidaminococcaceae bacterium]|nr:hypothetical protein [Acidaminococcaceae bacterium]
IQIKRPEMGIVFAGIITSVFSFRQPGFHAASDRKNLCPVTGAGRPAGLCRLILISVKKPGRMSPKNKNTGPCKAKSIPTGTFRFGKGTVF